MNLSLDEDRAYEPESRRVLVYVIGRYIYVGVVGLCYRIVGGVYEPEPRLSLAAVSSSSIHSAGADREDSGDMGICLIYGEYD